MSDECSICLECISVATTGRVEMSCSHTFHLKCIGTWLNKNSSCPMCRTTPSEMETLEEAPPEYEINSRINFNEYMISYSNMRISRIDTTHNTHVPEEPIPENTDGIPATDIRLVSTQTGMNVQQCLDALRRNNGDIVNSIMELVQDT